MTGKTIAPIDRLERNPLITDEGYRLFNRIKQHKNAPLWNYEVGDRLLASDLPLIQVFREKVFEDRGSVSGPPPMIVEWAMEMREKSQIFMERIPEGFNLERDWQFLETMDREDIAVRPESIVPIDADLSRLIVYDTSGTSGHALVVPYHPATIAQNHALVEFALGRYGVHPQFSPDMVACMCVSARFNTVVFPNIFSVWNQCGFAKVNFHPNHWKSILDAQAFFREMAPFFITGEPVGFAEMMRWEISARPAALISTALKLNPGLKNRLEQEYSCPVIDWYSVTETGPIAYSCPHGNGLHILPTDIYVEILDKDGFPVENGESGEITVSGGRNPYLPLLRYRTGDWGGMDYGVCSCDDPMPRIVNLDGRAPVFFRAVDGSVVNMVDIGRAMRECIFVQHEFIQRKDGSCDVNIRPAPGCPVNAAQIEGLLRPLFGKGVEIRVNIVEAHDREMEDGKILPYRNEMLDED